MSRRGPLNDDPLWYKDAIIYEVRVRSFFDSDGDGCGDFRGLTEKLDYLEELGVNAIWLLPFYPSPQRDDGYDISDYTTVQPEYGGLADFKHMMKEAHKRGIRVITELVVNHTSDQHPWFQRARRAKPGSKWRDFYVWSDDPNKFKGTRIIFTDFEPSNWQWDPVANAYYWHRFFHHQPDLNYDNPEVQKAVFEVLDFWMEMGVDGLRLDAVPYLYEREGTNCENLPETHAFLKKLRAHIDAHFPNRMLLAEANQWPEDAASYFGTGDECHMNFHFPIMPRLFMAVRSEDRFPIMDILAQTPPIPENAQWALFLRNHDELTLEMVTEEERDFMYRIYAGDPQARINLGIRRRLAPLLQNNREKIELLNGLLFSLPGTPVIYYGDEIGMGDNFYLGDRNGVRTPMQWSGDLNSGFSRANPQKLFLPVIIDPEYHYQAINVAAQRAMPTSLLAWMRRIIELRRKHKAFGRGSLEFLYPRNNRVLAFTRTYQDEVILVAANLSRNVQAVELDLSKYRGMVPVEMFGNTSFPSIGELPYFLTLGPHDFFWFKLERPKTSELTAHGELPTLIAADDWTDVATSEGLDRLGEVLPNYLRHRRWFGGKAKVMRSVGVHDVLTVTGTKDTSYIALLGVFYDDGTEEVYALPLGFATGDAAERLLRETPQAAIAHVRVTKRGDTTTGILYDAIVDRDFCAALLEGMSKGRRFKGIAGEAELSSTDALRELRGATGATLEPRPILNEQSNSSIVYGSHFVMKLFRQVESGVNPELEIGRFLTERVSFPHVPPTAGCIEYRRGRNPPLTLALLQAYVPNEGDAWTYAIKNLESFFERAKANTSAAPSGAATRHAVDMIGDEPPAQVLEMLGGFFDASRLLGQRTAELHISLTKADGERDFEPEEFTSLYQRSLYQSMRNAAGQTMHLLHETARDLEPKTRERAEEVLHLEQAILTRFSAIRDARITAMRTRTHGDYHLGQVLWTGKDFVIIDFEGEPARPISERRIKRSPLRDVAGMLRSYHYAAHAALTRIGLGDSREARDIEHLTPWSRVWESWATTAFLKGYLEAAKDAAFLPGSRKELAVLLDAYVLEKALYELRYELGHRPGWVPIPLDAILRLVTG